MRFEPAGLDGVWIVEIEPVHDPRGFFARTFCAESFAARGLNGAVSQRSISWSPMARTLRGLHWQRPPHAEAKLVRCTRGRIFDVAVDVRPHSPGFGRWTGFELDAGNRRALYIPEGFAHGFMTLADDTEVEYAISAPYVAEAARGVRWDDPGLAIVWPAVPRTISERDRTLPLLAEAVGSASCTAARGPSQG